MNRRMFTLTTAVLLAGALLNCGAEDGKTDSALPPITREKIDKLFAQWNLPTSPGCAVAVLIEGKPVYENYFGCANLENQIPISAQTVFNACSAAKEFTALAIQILVSSGKCQLDDPVMKYVPEIAHIGRPITIRQLLNHTSGIRDAHELACALGARDEDILNRADVLRLLQNQRTLNFEPGAQFLYSHSNYVLLALALERISGEAFGTFIRNRIFLPLGMEHSRIANDHSLVISHRAEPYKARGEHFQRCYVNDGFSGDGGLFTTLSDMERWDRQFDGQPIGGAETLARQIEPGTLNDGTRSHYASGLEVSDYRGWRTIGHNGGGGGYRATFLRFPQKRSTVILLANVSEIKTDLMARKIADLLLEGEAPPNENGMSSVSRKAIQISPVLYDKYAGEFDFDGRFSRRFQREEDQLVMILPDGKRVTAWPSSETRFFFKELPGEIEFPKVSGPFAKRNRGYLGDQVLIGRRVEAITLNAMTASEYAGDYYNDELRVVYRIIYRSGALVLEYLKGEIPFVSINADAFRRDTAQSPPDYGESLVADTLDFERIAAGEPTGFYLNNERMLSLKFAKVYLK